MSQAVDSVVEALPGAVKLPNSKFLRWLRGQIEPCLGMPLQREIQRAMLERLRTAAKVPLSPAPPESNGLQVQQGAYLHAG